MTERSEGEQHSSDRDETDGDYAVQPGVTGPAGGHEGGPHGGHDDLSGPMGAQPAPTSVPSRLGRRSLIAGGLVVAAAGAGGYVLTRRSDGVATVSGIIGPDSEAVRAAEAARRSTGRVLERHLSAEVGRVDLGRGLQAMARHLGDDIPGPTLRLTAGDRLRVTLTNKMKDPTTLHWHGLALRNDMDGVPDLTQAPIAPGAGFVYDFVVPDPGTYWFHSHVGVQLDTGLYGSLVVEDPDEPGGYDADVVVLLDDWTEGLRESPESILAKMAAGGMSGMSSMSGMSGMPAGSDVTADQPLGDDTGDVSYSAHLINGRLPDAPDQIAVAADSRVRLRFINAAADTAYRVGIGDVRLTVTHADGFPVSHVEVDSLLIGMGERYDVLVDITGTRHPIVAAPEGKSDPKAMAVLVVPGTGRHRDRTVPAEIPLPQGRLLTYADLVPADSVRLTPREPDRVLDLSLTMADGGRSWLLNDRPYSDREPLDVRQGERVRIRMRNDTTMFHPMHLHGHTFALAATEGRHGGVVGARKDTVNVLPGSSVEVDFDADNPGQWMLHCHNAYHGELGMMTVLSYVA